MTLLNCYNSMRVLFSFGIRESSYFAQSGLMSRFARCFWDQIQLVAARQTQAFGRKPLHRGFGNFNKPFAPARTAHNWLSRDPDEVDAYIADPLCGGPYTAGLWRDLTGGLLKIALEGMVSRIPLELPILISGGEQDPVGGERGMGELALHYAQTGHGRLTVKIYPGGRHTFPRRKGALSEKSIVFGGYQMPPQIE
jgi:alpha-beta hydrolase superfamily lysophospholipase